MKNKSLILIAAIIIIVISFSVGYKHVKAPNDIFKKPDITTTKPVLIGGDKDEHGCLGPAGYSWCATKNKCLRVWEEPCTIDAIKCEKENCHGLDIKCGSNHPQMCTMEYAIGDRCLQYAECGVQNGECQQIVNTQFTECKACVEKCIAINQADNVKVFECENKCK